MANYPLIIPITLSYLEHCQVVFEDNIEIISVVVLSLELPKRGSGEGFTTYLDGKIL